MLVYPVPAPGAYVLGVHSTLTTSGHVKIGPTVFPAFGNENYDGLQGLTPASILRSTRDYSRLLLSKERSLITHFITKELYKSLSLGKIVRDVGELQNFGDAQFKWYRSGIRP
jgi:L-2-hydroxyglutarate oxidase LhgO